MKRIIDFLKYRFIFITASAVLFLLFTAGTILNDGLNFGIDFVGGVKIIANFEPEVNETAIRDVLARYNPVVQRIGTDEQNEYIIAVKLFQNMEAAEQYELIRSELEAKFGTMNVESVENVGPAIGDILKKDAVKALLIAMLLMSIYLAFRFETKYSVGTMVAVVHDIALTVAFCGLVGIEINVPVIAAILTIFGYSVNDTIVIFDRIRENVHGKTKMTFAETINKSITQTMSRTILTSLTTLFAVGALYFIGGNVLNEFALVLIVGMVFGIYSTIFIASPVLLTWEKIAAKR